MAHRAAVGTTAVAYRTVNWSAHVRAAMAYSAISRTSLWASTVDYGTETRVCLRTAGVAYRT